MTSKVQISDMEFAALISSKICHDAIGPVGAIGNGLEILDEDKNPEAQAYALNMIRNVAAQASARLQFARFAFGAAGSQGAQIDLATAEQISKQYLAEGKHKLTWKGPPGYMAKERVKLLLNLVAAAITALPRGGDISVQIDGGLETPVFVLTCLGKSARPPQHLGEFNSGVNMPDLDALSIQPYYTCRLAQSSGMKLAIKDIPGGIEIRAV